MIYENFLPNYYSSLVKGQQQSILLDNLFWYVADGITQDAVANTNPKTILDEQIVRNQVIYGGRLTPQNTIAMIREIPWVNGKIFAKYNSRDPELGSKDFYCINSMNYVYKCIDNVGGSPSTQEPQNITPGAFVTADGYIWQYMYKLTDRQRSDFNIGGYIPLIVDPAVTISAVRGTISTIEIKDGGDYSNLHNGTIQQVINPTTIRISDSASNVNGTYNKMGFYISAGNGQGEYYQVSNYTANSLGRYVSLSDNLVGAGLGSQYEITPFVNITGNGVGARARAITQGRSITKVEILNRGMEYTLCEANLVSNTSYITSPGSIEVNLSPPKGHGGDPYQELYVNNLLINVETDNYTIPHDLPIDEISFCRIGTIRGLLDENTLTVYNEPTFNNTFIAEVPPISGTFQRGDRVVNAATGVPAGDIVYANTSHIIGVYLTPLMRFAVNDVLTTTNGSALGTVTDIIQPDVKLLVADIVSLANMDTTIRDENSREIIQMLVKVK